jgi:hypothetical protein
VTIFRSRTIRSADAGAGKVNFGEGVEVVVAGVGEGVRRSGDTGEIGTGVDDSVGVAEDTARVGVVVTGGLGVTVTNKRREDDRFEDVFWDGVGPVLDWVH